MPSTSSHHRRHPSSYLPTAAAARRQRPLIPPLPPGRLRSWGQTLVCRLSISPRRPRPLWHPRPRLRLRPPSRSLCRLPSVAVPRSAMLAEPAALPPRRRRSRRLASRWAVPARSTCNPQRLPIHCARLPSRRRPTMCRLCHHRPAPMTMFSSRTSRSAASTSHASAGRWGSGDACTHSPSYG